MALENTERSTDRGTSLDLAFEWLKPVIRDQLRTAEVLDQKASVMFALTTAMLAAGASFGIGSLTPDSIAALSVAGLGIAIYLVSLIAFSMCIRPRAFQSLNDPKEIRAEWISLPPDYFRQTMIEYTEDQHEANEALLKQKAGPVRWLVRLVIFETALLLVFLVLARLGL